MAHAHARRIAAACRRAGLHPVDPWRPRAGGPFVAFPAIVANIIRVPAMSVPLHWPPSGLPIGAHILGRTGEDATLFSLAGQAERARPWAHR